MQKTADTNPFRDSHARASWRGLIALALGAVVLVCAALLEVRFAGVQTQRITVGETPVTLYRSETAAPAPAVIVAHGFAGSRQMMDQIALSIARQGFVVASVDLPGHGRNRVRLSPEITGFDGATAQLVAVVEQVAHAIAARPDTAGPVSYVGHSMATDIVIRAAAARPDVGAVIAVSMYSPAVTQSHPRALLVLSGARETHLRQAGLEALHQIAPAAVEGETVSDGEITRRAAVAPYVGHVGVLYAPSALREITEWLRETTGAGVRAPLDRSGAVAAVLLAALTLLVWPLSRWLPRRAVAGTPHLGGRAFLACLILPVPAALAIAALPTFGIAGYAGFGTLGAILAVWGLIQIAVLHRAGLRLQPPDAIGAVAYLAAALLFALALDRYGAAFLPSGGRAVVLAGLLLGTVPLMLADSALMQGAALWRRVLARAVLLGALAGAMALAPTQLGLAFTVLPVLVLFFVVYGSMARWIAARRGASGPALGQGIVLAWAIAASTPLFAGMP